MIGRLSNEILQICKYRFIFTNIKKAALIFTEKYLAGGDVVVEIKVWQLPKSDWKRYPDKIKYRLVCINTKTRKKVLMDNHSPKGHHIHLDDLEKDYDFSTVEKLFSDFKKFVLNYMEVKI